MNTYIALFRGINVSGRHTLPMAEVKAVLERNGCVNVRTYIQSGNVILGSPIPSAGALAKRLAAGVAENRGFEPGVLVLTRGELARAVAGNPFPQADKNPKSLHLFFLAGVPARPAVRSLDTLKARHEAFALKGKVFYFYAPEGFGRSKLGRGVEERLGVDATARNWRTVTTLLAMADV